MTQVVFTQAKHGLQRRVKTSCEICKIFPKNAKIYHFHEILWTWLTRSVIYTIIILPVDAFTLFLFCGYNIRTKIWVIFIWWLYAVGPPNKNILNLKELSLKNIIEAVFNNYGSNWEGVCCFLRIFFLN